MPTNICNIIKLWFPVSMLLLSASELVVLIQLFQVTSLDQWLAVYVLVFFISRLLPETSFPMAPPSQPLSRSLSFSPSLLLPLLANPPPILSKELYKPYSAFAVPSPCECGCLCHHSKKRTISLTSL
ncbi:hypothetical protein M758_UG238600 [Ceratodon purpureus]|nr:hypothetical protein M758_UG238600 [Ceratodon purpureus]